MINKLYDEIKKTIKENYKLLLVFLCLMLAFTIEFPYYVEAPGGIIAVDERIEIENKNESNGSFNLAYVSEIKATIPTLIYAWINKDWDIIKKEEMAYENETLDDAQYRSHLLLDEANNNAIIVAYQKANKEIVISNEHLYITYVDKEADTNLKIGDEILEVDGIKIINKEQLDSMMLTKEYSGVLNIKVKRNEKEVMCYGKVRNLNNKKVIGVVLSKTSDIETDPDIKLNFKSSESGPSGGLILALSIYDSLIEKDITNGLKIVGTGTINLDGTVGSIGGIEYKIKGAIKEDADIFLVPDGENFNEAKKVCDEIKCDLELISVKTFDEALEKLQK